MSWSAITLYHTYIHTNHLWGEQKLSWSVTSEVSSTDKLYGPHCLSGSFLPQARKIYDISLYSLGLDFSGAGTLAAAFLAGFTLCFKELADSLLRSTLYKRSSRRCGAILPFSLLLGTACSSRSFCRMSPITCPSSVSSSEIIRRGPCTGCCCCCSAFAISTTGPEESFDAGIIRRA